MAKMMDPEIQEFSWYHCVGEFNKSLVVKVHNNTFWTMQRVEFKLQQGHWVAEPPATIHPKETVFFFAACHTLPRVEGSVMYKFGSQTQRSSGTLNIRVEKLNWVSFRWHLPVLGTKLFEEEKVDGADGLHFGLERTVGDINQWCTIVRWNVVQKIQSPTGTSELINMNANSFANIGTTILQPNLFPPTISPPLVQQSPQFVQTAPMMAFPQTPSNQPTMTPATMFPSTPMTFPSTPSFQPSLAPIIPSSQPTQPVPPTQPTQSAPSSELNSYQQKILDGYIDSLNKKSEEEMPVIDSHTGINIYYHMAQQWWDQGNFARKNGNLEEAYIMFMRYMTFVLEKLPAHMSHGLMKNDDYKSAAKAKCVKLMKELEPMQQQLLQAKKQDLLDNPTGFEFPSVPSHNSNKPPSNNPPPNNPNNHGNPPPPNNGGNPPNNNNMDDAYRRQLPSIDDLRKMLD